MTKQKWVLLASITLGVLGLYLLFLLAYPELSYRFGKKKFAPPVIASPPATSAISPPTNPGQTATAPESEPTEILYDTPNKLYIEKIGVTLDIIEAESAQALEHGAWHRRPQQGNPVIGGNFILTGHRFGFGLTPGEIAKHSSFYHLDKLQAGDIISIYWDQRLYEYEVESSQTVHPNAIWIEDQSEEHILTLYTCTLKGEFDGRMVVKARPVVSNE